MTEAPQPNLLTCKWALTFWRSMEKPDAPGGMIERYHMNVEASLYGDLVTPVKGSFAVPTGPGLGRDPDPDAIKTYAA